MSGYKSNLDQENTLSTHSGVTTYCWQLKQGMLLLSFILLLRKRKLRANVTGRNTSQYEMTTTKGGSNAYDKERTNMTLNTSTK